MNRTDDPAYAFIDADKAFPGRGLIAAGVIPWGIYWLSAQVVRWDQAPKTIGLLVWVLLGAASVVYLIGFWKGLKAKGYPSILFLVAFTGIIGTIVILFLPNRSEDTDNENKAP